MMVLRINRGTVIAGGLSKYARDSLDCYKDYLNFIKIEFMVRTKLSSPILLH